jgi:hypothetical protein
MKGNDFTQLNLILTKTFVIKPKKFRFFILQKLTHNKNTLC